MMKWDEVVKRARRAGIQTRKMNKTDVIRALQRSEGNFDCFGRSSGYCDRGDCAWRGDCLKPAKQSA